jgi:hypothetical protein
MTSITLRNDLIKIKNYDLPETTNGIPELHIIGCIVGNSGSGKTNAAVNLLQETVRQDLYDVYTIISPTGTKDSETGIQPEKKWSLIEFDEQYSEYNPEILDEIIATQRARIVAYQDYLTEKELYEKWKNRAKVPLKAWEELFINETYDDEMEEPVNPNKNERYPTQLILLDDCGEISNHDKIMKDFISRSRHNNASVITLVQYVKMIPKSFRNQVNMLMVFKTSDKKSLASLWEEFASSDMTFDTFQTIFDTLKHRHDFIMIDQKISDVDKKYRFNFDEYIVLSRI